MLFGSSSKEIGNDGGGASATLTEAAADGNGSIATAAGSLDETLSESDLSSQQYSDFEDELIFAFDPEPEPDALPLPVLPPLLPPPMLLPPQLQPPQLQPPPLQPPTLQAEPLFQPVQYLMQPPRLIRRGFRAMYRDDPPRVGLAQLLDPDFREDVVYVCHPGTGPLDLAYRRRRRFF